ncbi:hypothetical protein KJ359_013153 [Pestalotiopsis sp. 9143b]|nr:hypothetical protein KJ359_013153 [Pestalotiopsis sp. 9143b]
MCDFEEFLFECGHGIVRFKSNCHFRRNDPNKECYSVKVLRNSWKQDGESWIRSGDVTRMHEFMSEQQDHYSERPSPK